jgi:hypothetical protein
MRHNQMCRKFMGLAPADMSRLPHLLNTKNSFYSITLFTLFTLFYSVSWDYIYVELALFYKGIRPFLTGRSPSI